MNTGFLYASTGETKPSSSSLMTNPTTGFLFVNETIESPAYKVGDRREIRSHVRKGAARQFKQKHKAGPGQDVVHPKWRRLAPQEVGKDDLEDVNDEKGPPSCFPEGSKAACVEELSIGPVTDLTSKALSSLAEQPVVGCHTAVAPSTTALTITDPAKASESDLHGQTAFYCKACCRRVYCKECSGEVDPPNVSRGAQRRAGRTIMKRQGLRRPSEMSPLEVLGAGRVDPFLSYPVEDADKSLHEVMDLMVSWLVPWLRPDDSPQYGANLVSKSWFKAGLRSPLMFHSLAYSSSIHMDLMRTSQISLNSPRTLSNKLAIIQKLKEAIANRSENAQDEVIFTIFTLSCCDSINITEEKKKPFDSPLKRSEWLKVTSVYGNCTSVPEHKKALFQLITMRGGLEALKLPGLAENIISGSVLTAIHTFSKPACPPLRSLENYIDLIKVWAAKRTSFKILTSGFYEIDDHGVTDQMLEVLDVMGSLTMAMDHYAQGTPASLSIGQISRTRMAIQHRLLLLPSSKEIEIASISNPNIYECCRLTAMIFGIALFSTIPNTYNVLQTYSTHLKIAIEESGLQTSDVQDPSLSGVFLWVLMLGGIAALDKPVRAWFESQLALLIKKMGIDWNAAEEILGTFLWLDGFCGTSGRDLWAEVESLRDEYTVGLT